MMKKIVTIIMTICLLVPLFGFFNSVEISADTNYSVGCSIFEVSEATKDGTFKQISCHSDFESAKAVMSSNKNYVVRLAQSYSPMKIVAMNSGYAYTYPSRSGSSTMKLFYTPTFTNNTDDTYVGIKGIEMTYLETYSLNEDLNGKGKVKVVLNGWTGYTDLEYTDLVPSIFVENGCVVTLGGNDATSKNEQPYSVICKPNYYILKQNGNYLDIEFHYYWNYPNDGYNPKEITKKFSSGDQYTDFMKVGQKYYSNDGIRFYSDMALKNYVGTAYGYYLFLPLRTKTNISTSTFNKYVSDQSDSVLKGKGDVFVTCQNKYGVNALMVFAMACHESSYGTSGYAIDRYNLFGWNAIDSDPDQASRFSSVEDCVEQHTGYNLRKYLDRSNGLWYGSCIGTKGVGFNVNYASDPYWGYAIAALAYDIDKLDNNYDGDLSDYNSYNIGVVTKYDEPVYKNSNGSGVYYTLKYRSNHFNDYTVVLLGEQNGYYATQSTNPITSDGVVIDLDLNESDYRKVISYDWNSSIGYINKNHITKTSESSVEFIPSTVKDGVQYALVRETSIDNGVLYLKGISTITNTNYKVSSIMTQTIKLYDLNNTNKVYSYKANTISSDGYSISDGYDYTYTGFECSIDLTKLPKSTYIISVESNNSHQKLETILSSTSKSLALRVNNYKDVSYKLSINDKFSRRFELDIETYLIDYSKINKTSIRQSFIAFDSLTSNDPVVIDDEGNLTINGIAMIYYLDYNADNCSHNVYLVSDTEIIKMDTVTLKSDFDYQSYYNSEYKMDYITFKATKNISNLKGTYKIIVEINNGNYKDYVELTNKYNRELPSKTISGLSYSLFTDNVRYRVKLRIGD